MDITKATKHYEAWLHETLPVVINADLTFKHEEMASAPFPFMRATFYRWAQRWVHCCPHLVDVPVVLGVGDLHVENYGTWRDAEGRLVWGINDFDEATHLPYTADLVRLATSAALAASGHHLSSALDVAAKAMLAGYTEGLLRGGAPFVLAGKHGELRRLATGELRDPARFWAKMEALPEAQVSHYPSDAVHAVTYSLPGGADGTDPSEVSIRSRRAGLGSLGRPRLVALAPWQGAPVAREIKALLPSAWDWALDKPTLLDQPTLPLHYAEILGQAVRDGDPCTDVQGSWVLRRLAPDCARIELADLPAERDETMLLHSMGFELANIHLGTPGAGAAIGHDLAERTRQHPDWLVTAAERMVADTEADWNAWRA